MKNLVWCSLGWLLGSSALATVKQPVVLRDAKFNAHIQTVELVNLVSEQEFNGRYFKVVQGKSDQAIRFDDPNSELKLRAATTYYHLNKARDWFVQKVSAAYVSALPQIVVRIEHSAVFHEHGHYGNVNLKPEYNNALTVPAGVGVPGKVDPWGMEIWFRPRKNVHVSELKIKEDQSMGDWGALLATYRKQQHMTSLQQFLTQLTLSQTRPEAVSSQDLFGTENLIRTVGSSLLLEAVYRYADPLSRLFSRKWFWLDSALVPEIIYHEFAHIALSDHLVLSHSSAVIEGMADFFAGQIAASSELATHIKEHNVFNGKKATRKQQYMVEFETTDYANADFVFGMLWDLRSIVGESAAPTFVYRLRENIETSSTVRVQLIEGILKNCEENCKEPFTDRLKILQRYNSKGI